MSPTEQFIIPEDNTGHDNFGHLKTILEPEDSKYMYKTPEDNTGYLKTFLYT